MPTEEGIFDNYRVKKTLLHSWFVLSIAASYITRGGQWSTYSVCHGKGLVRPITKILTPERHDGKGNKVIIS